MFADMLLAVLYGLTERDRPHSLDLGEWSQGIKGVWLLHEQQLLGSLSEAFVACSSDVQADGAQLSAFCTKSIDQMLTALETVFPFLRQDSSAVSDRTVLIGTSPRVLSKGQYEFIQGMSRSLVLWRRNSKDLPLDAIEDDDENSMCVARQLNRCTDILNRLLDERLVRRSNESICCPSFISLTAFFALGY